MTDTVCLLAKITEFPEWNYFLKMNIKALIYARYSTSVKIHSVIKDDSNKSLSSDIDKVLPFPFSFLKKQKL